MEIYCFVLPSGEGSEGIAMETQCFQEAQTTKPSLVNDVYVVDGQIQSIVHSRETSKRTCSREKSRDYKLIK